MHWAPYGGSHTYGNTHFDNCLFSRFVGSQLGHTQGSGMLAGTTWVSLLEAGQDA